ncbi:hypothetical protein HIM_12000 [Hirsutella minnesotensis 3608]|uniref:Uncharacterized protein n=1 Tax=Hirsutella minnesotensis 3608 TaxID=1043627 RepID=A0A0F7ZWA1_9HYPO|nr:hypothetical protein HIM_12000 [Hirsutella minnesotensis 3608]
MAYTRRKRGYTNYRRGSRRTFTRYGKKSSWKRPSGKKRPASVTSEVKKQIKELKLMRHGQPKKYVLNGLPEQVNVRAYSGRNYYFALPIPDVLLGHCRTGAMTDVYVTGFRFEGDFFYRVPMEMFAVCVKVPAGKLPAIPLVNDTKTEAQLWTVDEPYVDEVFRAGFADKARDKTLFQAPMHTGVCPRGTVSFNGSKKAAAHKGRASTTFSRKGEASSTSVTDKYVKSSFRMWWDIGAKLTVCDSTGCALGSQYALLCGVRPQVDLDSPPEEEEGMTPVVAYLRDMQVAVYIRQ